MSLTNHLAAPLRGLAGRTRASPRQNVLTVSTPGIVSSVDGTTPYSAQKLSAVFAAVDIRSNSMSVLPAYVYDSNSRTHVPHDILQLLSVRPNEAMTPAVRKKMLESSICLTGRAGDWIIRDPRTAKPVELIPIRGDLIQVYKDDHHRPWYQITDAVNGCTFWLANEDFCFYPGPSRDGYDGQSVLSFAADTIRAGLAAQSYNVGFYESGGQPSGLLTLDADLSGYVDDDPAKGTKKDAIRREWEKSHSGPTNANRIAVLDFGMKYQPLTISQKDSKFIEQQSLTVQDIARFFGVPLYKLNAGSQSYNANEQQAIEYLSNLQPRITLMEEEQTWKLLNAHETTSGLEVRYNMMAALRSDSQSRSNYYKNMWGIGAYSVNDIRALEDMPDVEGGDEYMASLNYVPLSLWKELSINRNPSNGGENNRND